MPQTPTSHVTRLFIWYLLVKLVPGWWKLIFLTSGSVNSLLSCFDLKTIPVSFPTDGNKQNVTLRQCTEAAYRIQTGTMNPCKARTRTIFHRRDICAVVRSRPAALGFRRSAHSTQRPPSCERTIEPSAITQSENHFHRPLETRPLRCEYRGCVSQWWAGYFFYVFVFFLFFFVKI